MAWRHDEAPIWQGLQTGASQEQKAIRGLSNRSIEIIKITQYAVKKNL